MSVCPKCKDVLSDGARACACGWRMEAKRERHETDLECPWNDHGEICGKKGSISDALNGSGPWYCPDHYWRLKGRLTSDNRHSGSGPAPCSYPGCDAEGIAGKNPFFCLAHYGYSPSTYRESWYATRGLPPEPPKPGLSVKVPKR